MIQSDPNFRALEKLATTSGRRIRPGLVFRSGASNLLQAGDRETLAALGIVYVCDLRSTGERDRAPSAWLEDRAASYAGYDLLAAIPHEAGPWKTLAADPTPKGAHEAMTSLYAAMPIAAGKSVVEILERVAKGQVPVVIHCTAGKDRTGFVIAILLLALGVDRETIVADYLGSTGRQTAAAIEGTRGLVEDRIGQRVDETAIKVLMGVERAFIETSLAIVDGEFGGIDAYLRRFGASPDLLAALRDRLLD